jgi:hypothetical protein
MQFCTFTTPTAGTPCELCGRVLHRDLFPGEIFRQACPGKPLEQREHKEPSLAKQAWNYGKAVAKWKLAGSPTRTEAEIAERFAICEACEFFSTKTRPHCTICGCTCSETTDGLKSKLAMRTETCPLDPPKWQ